MDYDTFIMVKNAIYDDISSFREGSREVKLLWEAYEALVDAYDKHSQRYYIDARLDK